MRKKYDLGIGQHHDVIKALFAFATVHALEVLVYEERRDFYF